MIRSKVKTLKYEAPKVVLSCSFESLEEAASVLVFTCKEMTWNLNTIFFPLKSVIYTVKVLVNGTS